MKIVLLESLGIPASLLEELSAPLTAAGHEFVAYDRAATEAELLSQARGADVLMLASMSTSAPRAWESSSASVAARS